ncbi:hypothetical protein DFS34DRAFT_591545 [Phlyctochytrium arcticum]|nr:hypothetical protein DFS34DRAFT_591545 [Phlyctochytrium arcticum]
MSSPALSSTVDARPLTPLVSELLQRNHDEHHMYFNNGFHNHFPHALLSQFALHANDKRLSREWDLEAYLEKLKDPHPDVIITEQNWKDHLGKRSHYPNYLRFFDEQVAKHGIVPSVVKYAFDEQLFNSTLSGILHPLIHLGFGVEFESLLVTAEGLAQTATTGPTVKPLLDALQSVENHTSSSIPSSFEYNADSVVPFFDLIRNDPRLKGAVPYSDNNKSNTVMSKFSSVIAEYARLWEVKVDDPASLNKALDVTLYTAALLYATTGLRPEYPSSPKLDFFLLHMLTSGLSILHIAPHLVPELTERLLKSHLAISIMYFITRGCPALQPSALKALPIQADPAYDSWEKVFQLTHANEDIHVPKAVRTLKIAEERFGSRDGFWLQAARLTVEKMQTRHGSWSYAGCGYSEAWEKENV